jgi:hypothetical protein
MAEDLMQHLMWELRIKALEWEDDHSRRVLHGAKLVTTFSAGIAAAFVVAGLQEGKPTPWDGVSVGLMAVTIGLAIWVVAFKRKARVEIDEIGSSGSPGDLYGKHSEATEKNAGRADFVHNLMLVQLGFALLTCGAATIPFLASIGLEP